MYDISELEITGKDMAIAVLIVFILLVGFFFAGYCLGSERTKDLLDNGDGTKPISNELGNAGTAISNAGAGISEAQGHADQVGAGITDAQGQADYIHSTATTSTEIVRECQSIIERIRSRGKTQTIKN